MSLFLDKISKRFTAANTDKMAGIESLQFQIAPGEGFSLLGPSGCGKTTTLRILGGFEQPDSGRLLLHNKDITKLPPQARPIRTVFQRYALFPHLNVWQNIVFGLRMQRLSAQEIKRRGQNIVELLEIASLLERPIAKLSGGEQQRVALARALITEPEILLLDEPFSALDLKLRERLQLELLGLKNKLGNTFIFVTHDQSEAMLLSDRIAVMREGVIQQIASPEELYWRPINKFVASFIGQANFFSPKLALLGARDALAACRQDQEWMVRAECLRIRMPGALAAAEVGLPVTIQDQVFRGQERLYRVATDENISYLVSAPGNTAPVGQRGSKAVVSWKAEDAWAVSSS